MIPSIREGGKWWCRHKWGAWITMDEKFNKWTLREGVKRIIVYLEGTVTQAVRYCEKCKCKETAHPSVMETKP